MIYELQYMNCDKKEHVDVLSSSKTSTIQGLHNDMVNIMIHILEDLRIEKEALCLYTCFIFTLLHCIDTILSYG